MAIEKGNTTPGAVNAETRSAPQFQNDPAQATPRASRALGLSDLGALRTATVSRLGAGETVEGFKRAFEKILETQPAERKSQFQFMVLNRDTDRVYNSTLVITRPLKYRDELYVVTYALPVEASNPINEVRQFQSPGQTAEIAWAASDVLDRRFIETMTRHVQQKHGEKAIVIYAGGRPLPVELKSEDENHLLRVLFEADQAMVTATEKHILGGAPEVLSVAMFKADNYRASVNVVPVPAEADDSVGNPVRSGITIEMRASRNVSQNMANQSLNERNQDIPLTRVQAYIDPTYDTRHLLQTPSYPGAPQDSRCFLPRVVIRTVDAEQQMPLSPESHLLGVLSATALSQHIGLWANSLRPRNFMGASSDLQRMTDIGGVGLIAPLNPANREELVRIKTDPREFSDKDFESLISRTFIHDDTMGPIYTLLVEEAGERSWLTDTYYFAAEGDAAAMQEVARTVDNLTDGHFSRLWQQVPDQRIAHNDQNRVHLGYFVDNQGKRVDLQHVDTLAIINLYGEKDKQLVFDWIQTFNPTTGTMEQRLALREQILRNTFNQVTIKGYGRLLTFYQQFLETANRALRAAGLEISPANTRAGEFQTRPQFGVLDPAVFSIGVNRTGGVFTASQMAMGPGKVGIGGMMSGNYGQGIGRL